MSETVIVITPVYKASPSAYELESIRQGLKVLYKHPFAFICPESLNMDYYERLADECGKDIYIYRFHDSFFRGIEGYNNLCLDRKFYLTFSKYDYMLIYQPDAWVFRDDLLLWCNKGYDYIGAPWPHLGNDIGNGGFSLRKINKFITILEKGRRVWSTSFLLKELTTSNTRTKIRDIIRLMGVNNSISYLRKINPQLPEDLIFGHCLQNTSLQLSKPHYIEASLFSLENSPLYYYTINNKALPFGCHQPYREDVKDFWLPFIPQIDTTTYENTL